MKLATSKPALKLVQTNKTDKTDPRSEKGSGNTSLAKSLGAKAQANSPSESWLRRSFDRLSAGFKALASGEGGAVVQRSIRDTGARLKTFFGLAAGSDVFESAAGVTNIATRQRQAAKLIGTGSISFVPQNGLLDRNLAASVDKRFRGQVLSGLTAASSRAVGSTLLDAPSWNDVSGAT